jgi:predicted RNase H-like HicB family nuclease
MKYQVFIQHKSEDKFVASVVGMPNLTVEGSSEFERIPGLSLGNWSV